MKLLKNLAAFVAITAFGSFAVGYIAQPNLPNLQPFLDKAMHYDVDVIRDNWGIPHIYGQKDIDTAFGLGYAQSEDDFETLQTVLLATRGTLAAELGPDAAKTDFVVQFMGVWDAVNSQYKQQVPQKIKDIAQAYADGINLYAAENPDAVSRYLLPVTDKDIIAGFTFKTPMFYGFDRALGALVDADMPHEIAKTMDQAMLWKPVSNLPIGSQGIAIAPDRSDDGLTHLLVNSHQPLTGPVAWYEASLHSNEGWNMAGSTFPGSPVIIHGHNENLGWANTVNTPDLVDFYQMKINPDNADQYLLDGEWETFETKTAKMQVKLLGPIHWTFEKTIKISQHGPVMETQQGLYAARWAGMNNVGTLEAMFATNKASNKDEFEAALKLNTMPSINFVYADKEGNIAHYYNAMFPNRIEGWEWHKVLPGDKSELIWQGYRDFSMMPKTVNPQSGLVYNANNPPFMATDGDDDAQPEHFPASMGIETLVTNRAHQIEELFKGSTQISKQQLRKVKYDLAYNPESYQIQQLSQWLTRDLSTQLTDGEESAREMLRQWDLSTHKDNPLAALAVLTMAPIQKAQGKVVEANKITSAFKQAVAQLVEHHGHVDVAYGDVMRIIHGDKNLPISGGPDTMRAVYGQTLNDEGQAMNIAGDGFMMFVAWGPEGLVASDAIHQFGSATLDKSSPHYNDQMDMFVNHQERKVLFKRDDLETHIERIYQPGRNISSATAQR